MPAAADNNAASESMRLARYLARCGLGSRRACETLIEAGEISVNGHVVTRPATVVNPGRDVVRSRGEIVHPRVESLYLALNKPPGYTCSARDSHARRLVYELVPAAFGRLFSVGRLDRDSEGLILLTNDGDYAQRVGHPSGEVRKTYLVWVNGPVSGAALRRLAGGIHDRGEWLRPHSVVCVARRDGETILRFVLGEGRKREIRRLCRAVNAPVGRLRRVAIGSLTLGNLAPGAWRRLTSEEANRVFEKPSHADGA